MIAPKISESEGKIHLTTETRLYQPINASSNDLKDYLAQLVTKYGLDGGNYKQIYNVIVCESNFKIDTYSKNKISFGIAQFTSDTWSDFNKERKTDLNYYNPFDQLDMMVWAFKNGYNERWDCFRMLYN